MGIYIMKNLTSDEFQEKLKSLSACRQAIDWARGKDFKEVWQTCERGDWMLWLVYWLTRNDSAFTLQQITKAKVKCARLVQHLMKDKRSIDALDVAERFSEGLATREELAASYDAAAVYAAAYAAAAAADAAYVNAAAAADAAYTYAAAAAADAYAAAYAYDTADDAAAYAAAADDAYAYDTADARRLTLKKCSDICREFLPINFEE